MKKFHFLNKNYLEKRDILSLLSNTETDYYIIYEAYVTCGMLYIRGRFKPDIGGEITRKLLPTECAPKSLAMGSWGCSNSMDNITRIGYVRIENDGSISLWIDNIGGGEHFMLRYPLEVEQISFIDSKIKK